MQMGSGTADEPEDEHHFHGEMYYLTITTGQSFRVLYKSTQLLSLRDDLNKALEENGFDKVQPEKELLQTVILEVQSPAHTHHSAHTLQTVCNMTAADTAHTQRIVCSRT